MANALGILGLIALFVGIIVLLDALGRRRARQSQPRTGGPERRVGFERGSRWMVLLFAIPPLLAVLFAMAIPRLAR
jgi:hypothetical protein